MPRELVDIQSISTWQVHDLSVVQLLLVTLLFQSMIATAVAKVAALFVVVNANKASEQAQSTANRHPHLASRALIRQLQCNNNRLRDSTPMHG